MRLQCVSQNFWQTFLEVLLKFPMFTTNLAIFIIMQLSRKSRTWEGRDQFHVKVRSSQVTSFSSSPKYEQVAFETELIFYNGRFIDLDGNLQGQKGWQKLSAYLWHPCPQGLFPWLRTGGKRPWHRAGHMTNKHPNNFFSIKASHCVFELSIPCVCLFHCAIATEFDYRIQYNRFRVVLHAVDSLNVKHEVRSKKIKQFCIMQTFPNDISRFGTWKSCFTFCMN